MPATLKTKPSKAMLPAQAPGVATGLKTQAPTKAQLAKAEKIRRAREVESHTESLHDAIKLKRGGLRAIDRAIAAGADVEAKGEVGVGALGLAIKCGNQRAIDKLLAKADPAARCVSGRSMLSWAIVKRDHSTLKKIAEKLLAQASKQPGAACPLDATDGTRATPLMHAIRTGRSDMARLLLDMGASPTAASDGQTPLMVAVSVGDNDTFEALLPLSDTRAANRQGETALMMAASCGNADAVEILAKLPGFDAVDNSGGNAMMHAARSGEEDAMRTLARVCDLWTEDCEGQTALMRACGEAYGMEEMVEMMAPLMVGTRSDVEVMRHLCVAQGLALAASQAAVAKILKGIIDAISERIELSMAPVDAPKGGARGKKARL